MDKNSTIGLILIAAILLVYFNYFAPKPSGLRENKSSNSLPEKVPEQRSVSKVEEPTQTPKVPQDSSIVAGSGVLSSFLQGTEQKVQVENKDLALTFSNHGGILQHVQLKDFQTYDNRALDLITKESGSFSLIGEYEGEKIDLSTLYYESESHQYGDTTRVVFTATFKEGALVRHVYSIPASGFEVVYKVESVGLALTGNVLTFQWDNQIRSQEKDVVSSRNKTTINYYSVQDGFSGLSETSTDKEIETIANPLQWVAIKQKFFISALIAGTAFQGGEVHTSVNLYDSSVVKAAHLTLFIPLQEVTNGGSEFRYFFGPTKYSLLSGVAEKFSNNVSLGWPPVMWVNQFLIIPIFKFLERYISNYGLIIIILVLIIKVILSPLSYKSYLSMAKMKLLKPELDLLKEQYGDDPSKIQKEQLKLYQEAGVNPFSGCIPMVLQMPILLAMFYFFPVSIELRQAPFLWADDLSTYDSILDLPFHIPFYGNHVSLFVLLMTASTLIYTWQNNQISSAQGPMKSMSYAMPVVFMFVLNSFSAGLSFYYFISNLVTFGQQALIRKFVDEDKIKVVMKKHKQKILSGNSKQSRFMTKLQNAMKASEEARNKKSK